MPEMSASVVNIYFQFPKEQRKYLRKRLEFEGNRSSFMNEISTFSPRIDLGTFFQFVPFNSYHVIAFTFVSHAFR